MGPLETVRRAALFVADVLSSVNLAPFLKKHHIKDKRYGWRLIDRLRSKFSLEPADRPGRPRVYTVQQLAAGQAELSSASPPIYNAAELVQRLKDRQQLPATATPRGYLAALKRHLQLQGLQTGYGPRTMQHALTKSDERQRLAWCQSMQHKITDSTIKDWWFEDEKSINSAGTMRGECGGKVGYGQDALQRTHGSAGRLALHPALGGGRQCC